MIGSFVLIMGFFIGSFLYVCIWRLPRKESIIMPPSHCPKCQTRLKPWDLVPLVSYVINWGRCRYCGGPISLQYLLIEVLTGFVYLLTYLEFGLNLQGYLMLSFVSALIVVAGIDAQHRYIPDLINIPGIVVGLLAAVFSINVSFLDALMGFLACGGLFLLIALITRGGMGGGDIKLMAFVGAFLGLTNGLLTIFLGSLFGSFYGLYLVLTKKGGRKTAIPYGPFLSLGAFLIALYGDEIVQIYIHYVLLR